MYHVVEAVIVGIFVPFFVCFKLEIHPKSILFGILTGMTRYIGALAFLYAVSKGKSSTVVTVTALYPIASIMLSYFILHESITVKQFVGIFLALCALFLFIL